MKSTLDSKEAGLKNLLWRYLGLFAVSGVVIALDQWTKSLLRSRLATGESWPEQGWLLLTFKLVRTENSGAAFSMGSGLGTLFLLFSAAASIAILIYFPRLPKGEPLLTIGVGLLLGGAVGNLIDRLTIGQVTDFLAIRYFAVVNVADICITSGAAAMILWVLLKERKEKAAQ
jgi:signal peptidase II